MKLREDLRTTHEEAGVIIAQQAVALKTVKYRMDRAEPYGSVRWPYGSIRLLVLPLSRLWQ